MATKVLPNLFDFLRDLRLRAESKVKAPGGGEGYMLVMTSEELDWLNSFLRPADFELHFKAHRVGGSDDFPVYEQHYLIAGEEVDIFSLLTEAMLQNHTFAHLIQASAKFYQDHVPTCQHCKDAIIQATVEPSWEFTPHPVKEREAPCIQCPTGEMVQVGFTQPNGRMNYECNVCGHEERYP
jgi:hypothetical protein